MYWCEEMHRELPYDLRQKMTLVCTILHPLHERQILTIEARMHHTDRRVRAWPGGKTQPSVSQEKGIPGCI
jgi:hypothetical protein